MGPENAQIMAQLTMLAKAIRNGGGGSEEVPLGGYVTRYDHGEEYFQEDGKGYLLAGAELTDPKLYDTKAYPLMNVMPTLDDDYYWSEGMNPGYTDPANTIQWTWNTNDDTYAILGTNYSFCVTKDGVNWKTRHLLAVKDRTWNTGNDLIHGIIGGLLVNGSLYVIATSKTATSTYKLYKLDADFNVATEIPLSTGAVFFTKTNGRYYCAGNNWLYDLTNPAEPVRYVVASSSFRDITRWKDEWWLVYSNGLVRTADLSVAPTMVVPASNIYCVGSNADELVYVTTNAVMYATDPVTPVFNSATGPEILALGSTATSFKMTEANGKFLVRGDGNNRVTHALNALVEYNPIDHTWEEIFCPHGYTGFGAQAMPMWYRGEYWFTGNRYTLNGYSRSVDMRAWSSDEFDARLMSSYQAGQNSVQQTSTLAGVASDGDQKILFVHTRHIVYSIDGGVTYRCAYGPWKTASLLTCYGVEVFYDGGEFFVFSYRGNWKTTDFVNWTPLDQTLVLQATSGGAASKIVRLPNGVWVSHGLASASQPTWYTTDRGTTWKVSVLVGIRAIWWDSKRSKYGACTYGYQIGLTSNLDTALTISNTTSASWFSSTMVAYYDEALDRLFTLSIGGGSINSVDAVQYTTQTNYTTMQSHLGQVPQMSLDSAYGATPTEFVRIGGELYAISNTIGRCTSARPYLMAIRFKADRTVDYVPLEFPVEAFELTQALMGDRYPAYAYNSNTHYYIQITADTHSDPNKKRFFLCGYWFELSLVEPKISLKHSPQAGFGRVSRLLQLPRNWRPKFASDGKGTVAFVNSSVLYVSKDGGEFLPKMTVGAQSIQYGQGIWVMSVLVPSSNWNGPGQGGINLALTIAYSTDLENWKSMLFAEPAANGKVPIEFRPIHGKWVVLRHSSISGASSTDARRIGGWLTSGINTLAYPIFTVKDGDLVDAGNLELPYLATVHRLLLQPLHGVIQGVEFAQYQHGDYALLQGGGGGYAGTSFEQDVYAQTLYTTAGSSGDTLTVSWGRVVHKSAASLRGAIFTDTAVASWVCSQGANIISGVECPIFHGIPYSVGSYSWQQWGKHNYFFVQNTSQAGMRLLLDPTRYRVIANVSGNYTVNTTDDGQIFIVDGNGTLFRGVKGIHAAPRPAKSTGYQYRRVL